jgi:hypothetical protein
MKLRSFTEWLELQEAWETDLPVNDKHSDFVENMKKLFDKYFSEIKDTTEIETLIRVLISYLMNYEPKRKQNSKGDLNVSMSPYNY